jgi:DNA-binding response OmpR family regulator
MITHSQLSPTILAVDNDSNMRAAICGALKREGHHVIEAEDAQTALQLAREWRPDIIILDSALADMSGFELCTHLRAMPFVDRTPILFVSENLNAQSAAQALDSGADDYLRKPFATRELNARVRALLRRSPGCKDPSPPTLRIDPDHQEVWINGENIELTPTEFGLLDYLCRYPAEMHTANDLLENLWDYPPGSGDTALVRNHIRNLRRKIEVNPDYPAIIVSLHGRGYTTNAHVVYVEAEQAASN